MLKKTIAFLVAVMLVFSTVPVLTEGAEEAPQEASIEVAEAPAAEEPSTEQPAEEKPAEEKPVETQPAEETPVQEEPVEEQPAAEEAAAVEPAEVPATEEEPAAAEEAAGWEPDVTEEPVAEEPDTAETPAEEPIVPAETPAVPVPAEEPAEEPAPAAALFEMVMTSRVEANIYEEANENSRILSVVAKDTDMGLVTVYNLSWAKVKLADGTVGFISRDCVYNQHEWDALDAAATATEEPAAEEPTVPEEPAVEEPAVPEEPAAEEPAVTEEPAAEEPAVQEEPAAEEPAVREEPAAEEPAVTAKPAAEEPAATAKPAAEKAQVQEKPAAEAPAENEKVIMIDLRTKPAEAADPVDEEQTDPDETAEAEERELPVDLENAQTIVLEENEEEINVREGANGLAAIFTSLPEGAEVTILNVDGDWVTVLVDQEIGYIYMDDIAEYLDLKEEPAADDTEESADEPVEIPKKVTIFTSRRRIMQEGEPVYLTSKLEGFEDCEQIFYQWYCDKGNGYEPVAGAVSDTYIFMASAETLAWSWQLGVSFK